MSINQTGLSPMGEVLKKEWNNGWKTRCEKEIKKWGFQKALHHSAKDHVKFWNISPEFKALVAEFIDLGVSRKFTTRVLKILDIKCESVVEMEAAINNVLSETSQKIDTVISQNENNETQKTQLTKDDLIKLWNEKWLAEAVIEEWKILPIRKALLKVLKEYLEKNMPNIILTQKFYIWIESNVTKFFKNLQEILETKTGSYEEIIQTLYNGRKYRIEDFQSLKAKPITFKTK